MESIDALAKAINEFKGGMVLVSHDMRLISQVAKEIWICDNKKIEKYKGDIQSFKMNMRAQMGIDGEQAGKLRGDASILRKDGREEDAKPSRPNKPPEPKLEVVAPPSVQKLSPQGDDGATATTNASTSTFSSFDAGGGTAGTASAIGTMSKLGAQSKGSYVPPHLRKKMSA